MILSSMMTHHCVIVRSLALLTLHSHLMTLALRSITETSLELRPARGPRPPPRPKPAPSPSSSSPKSLPVDLFKIDLLNNLLYIVVVYEDVVRVVSVVSVLLLMLMLLLC